MPVRSLLVILAVVASMATASVACAYDETGTSADPSDCIGCHGEYPSVDATDTARQGPHGGYSTTSNACAACHSVHSAAADGRVLLPGETLTETCELCHDGTGGRGVYGAIEARGLTVGAAHRTDTTASVPGADASTGTTATLVFSGVNSTLSCGDCHSPHGTKLVDAFTADRRRIETDTVGFFSSELLRQRPFGGTTAVSKYGSDWCASCHAGRITGEHETINHPVDSTSTAGAFTYENVQVVDGVGTTQTVAGALGGSNFGYVMPYPRTAGQGTHAPICQQCHEDARSVGDTVAGGIVAGEVFSVTSADGSNAADTPRFQVFPHESVNEGLLLENGNDLCTNCHMGDQLP